MIVTKREIEVRQIKKTLLREVTVKIGLKQEEEKEEVVTEALLDSGVTGLVMSEEFARRYKFRRTKLERLVFKGHKERTSINVIGG